MKWFLILFLVPCLAFGATKKQAVEIDPNTGLAYPRSVKGHGWDIPANSTMAGVAIATGSSVAGVASINGATGVVTITKATVGLSNADNTSDANKPISIAAQTALDAKGNIASSVSQFTGGTYLVRDIVQMSADMIDGYLSGMSAGSTAQNLFSTRNNTTSTYVRSTAWFGHALDLTAVSVWTDETTSIADKKTVTLVNPNIGLAAHHVGTTVGRHYRFVSAIGTVTTLTVQSVTQVGTSDFDVVKFTTSAPSGITPMKVLPIATVANDALVGALFLFIDQNQQGFVAQIASLTAISYTIEFNSAPGRTSFFKSPVSGDSSHPAFILLDGAPVLLGHLYTATQVEDIRAQYSQINAVITGLGGSVMTPLAITSFNKANYHLSQVDDTHDLDKNVNSASISYGMASGDSLNLFFYRDYSGTHITDDPDLSAAPNVFFDGATATYWRAGLGLGTAATKDTGTSAGTVATGDHTHVVTASATTSGSITPSYGSAYKTVKDYTVTGNITSIASPGGSPASGDLLELNFLLSGGAWTLSGWNAIYALGDNPPTIPATSGKVVSLIFEYSALKTKWLLRAVSDTY